MVESKKWGVVGAVVLTVCGVWIHAAERSQPAEESVGVEWQSNLKAAHRLAVRDNKPLLIVFGAEWCHFCKKLEEETLAHPALARYINDTYVPVHLDFDKDDRVRDILQVERLPCTILLTKDAEILDRFEGYMPPADIYKKLAAAKQVHLQLVEAAGTATIQ
ncbi:MAG: thioredoxin family protein [Planctomycetaceae bacterium]|nr:thioredoxin family protein [Planctomycetaceae bacterium]